MSPFPSAIVSIIVLLFGLVAVFAMITVQGGRTSKAAFYTRLHKWAGYSFAVLFMFLFATMLWRVEDYWEESSSRVVFHVVLSLMVFFLLSLKIFIARSHKHMSAHLFNLGVLAFALTFTSVGITAGYYAIWRAKKEPYISHAGITPGMEDIALGKELFITKCSTCHVLDTIMRDRSPVGWEKVVNDMVELAAPRITVDEGKQILNYLVNTHVPKPVEVTPETTIIQARCLPCHKATEIFKVKHTRAEWTSIVKQMHGNAPELIPLDKVSEIVDYLVETQQN